MTTKFITVTVANAANEPTSGIDIDDGSLSNYALVGFIMPSTFDGTSLKLKMSNSLAGTYVFVQSAGADYALTTTASVYTPVENLAIVSGAKFIKPYCVTAQTGATDIILVLREV